MSKVLAFSPTNAPGHPGAVRLAKSAQKWGWEHYFVDQDGWERSTYRAEQEGILKFLDAHPEAEYVMYMDAWDTVFVGPPQELRLTKGILSFCGDKQCFPNELLKPLFSDVYEGQFRFLNAGVIWGDAKVLRQLSEEYLEKDSADCCNQTFFAMTYLKEIFLGRHSMQIDHNADTALNLWGMMDKEKDSFSEVGRRGKRVWYRTRDTFPLVLHAAGSTMFHELPPIPRWIEFE